ncbi:MAG: hypothetical protein WBM44_04760 [Waterburya sp.]
MQLPKLTLVPPKIQSGDLFPALELVMDSKALSQAIAETQSQEKRKRILPTYVIVALVIAILRLGFTGSLRIGVRLS